MGLFDKHMEAILFHLREMGAKGKVTDSIQQDAVDWPMAGDRDLVLGVDTAVELGHPKEGSTAVIVWANEPTSLKNRRISIIGPDLPALVGNRVPFGKMVLLGGEAFNEDNSYERYRQLENVRYDMRLKGYMMRGVSQYGMEWSRVSHEAIKAGFSLAVLGEVLAERFLAFKFIQSVEVVFITSGLKDMQPFVPIADSALRIISAMNKMIQDVSFDCESCEYNDVCTDVQELRAMRKTLVKRKETAHA
jgi:CO dehydrogenase/acetyl-CoA synthase beta subunit